MAMYDGILVTKIDRLTRIRDWGIREWAEKNGKKILVCSPEMMWPPEPGDTTTPMQWDLLVNVAATEWTNTSQRYKRALKSLRDQGYFSGGRNPYGYRIVCAERCGSISKKECKHHTALEPDPVTAPIVRGMARKYLDGQSLRQIADWLTSSAIPVPRMEMRTKAEIKWSAQTVKNILTNPAIIGRAQVNGRTTHRCEPIISVEDFRRIKETLAGRGRRRTHKYDTALLTSMLVCKNGHSMYRQRASNKTGRYYYYCKQCPKGERPFIWCEEIDAAVHEAVMHMKDEDHIVTTVKPGDTYGEEINLIKKEIASLAYSVEEDGYDARLASLREEIRHLRSLPRKPAEITEGPDGRKVGDVWESLDTTGRRQWLLARRGSNWLPGQEHVKVQVFGRDPETGTLITDIDLGEVTESIESLRRL